jgi:hypothetical protein
VRLDNGFGTIAVPADEIVAFARLFDPQTFHTDPEAAERNPFGGLIASGWHTASLMTRLFMDHYPTKVASLGSPNAGSRISARGGSRAKVIKRGDYHVFFTPKGDCRGLYVRRQGGASFEVREQLGGKSNVAFSYRIVGRRKDFKAERFAKAAIPKAPKSPKLPAAPKVKERSPTKPSVRRPPSGALSAD